MVRRFRSRLQRLPVYLLLCLLCVSTTFAQRLGSLDLGGGALRVHVVGTDDRPLGQAMRVRLMGAGGASPLSEAYTDNSGEVTFNGITPGTYHVLVTGQGYEDTDSGAFQLEQQRSAGTVFVHVKRTSEDQGATPGGSRNPTVDVSLLKAPKKALQEFQKGNELLSRQEWQKAADHLRKAIEIYPEFVDAYNNLAVAYARMEDRQHEREALDQALKLNPRSVQALVNRARLALKEKDLATAEGLLSRATAADPNSLQILMLLAKVQLFSGHNAAAVATARQLHSLPHSQYAVVHYLAARALEGENRLQDAASELHVFLQEESTGARADAARKEIGLLESGNLPVASGNE